MGAVGRLLVGLDEDLERELRKYHPAAQVRRGLGVFASTFLLQLGTSGPAGWTWKGAGSVALAAAYLTLRQVEPTLPWATVERIVLQGGSDKPTPPAATPDASHE